MNERDNQVLRGMRDCFQSDVDAKQLNDGLPINITSEEAVSALNKALKEGPKNQDNCLHCDEEVWSWYFKAAFQKYSYETGDEWFKRVGEIADMMLEVHRKRFSGEPLKASISIPLEAAEKIRRYALDACHAGGGEGMSDTLHVLLAPIVNACDEQAPRKPPMENHQ